MVSERYSDIHKCVTTEKKKSTEVGVSLLYKWESEAKSEGLI